MDDMDYECFAGVEGKGFIATFTLHVDGKDVEYSAIMDDAEATCLVQVFQEDTMVMQWTINQEGFPL